MNFDEVETTGIACHNDNHNDDDIYYNLNGQRVDKPLRGLYIVNGKKIVIK